MIETISFLLLSPFLAMAAEMALRRRRRAVPREPSLIVPSARETAASIRRFREALERWDPDLPRQL